MEDFTKDELEAEDEARWRKLRRERPDHMTMELYLFDLLTRSEKTARGLSRDVDVLRAQVRRLEKENGDQCDRIWELQQKKEAV